MNDAVFSSPAGQNEEPLSYSLGSPERKRLKTELERLRGECFDIPLVIGGKYAYRNTWQTGNAASGVYIYVLRGQKAGSTPITRKGKVAVVR